MSPNSNSKIETEERNDIAPLCPHCDASIRKRDRHREGVPLNSGARSASPYPRLEPFHELCQAVGGAALLLANHGFLIENLIQLAVGCHRQDPVPNPFEIGYR